MSFIFTSQELAQIGILNDQAVTLGNYAAVYEYIADTIALRAEFDASRPSYDQDVHAAYIWFRGAKQVNEDQGVFATFIREYTRRQGQLRYGETFTVGEMQVASNRVAIAVISDILDQSNGGLLPTISQIAGNDATEVGRTLFNRDLSDTAAAPTNAAWSGSVLFSALESDQSGRLLVDSSFNTLNDLRDVVFAYESFQFAYDAVLSSLTFLNILDAPLAWTTALINGEWPSGLDGDGALETITRGGAGYTALQFVESHNRYGLVDSLRKLFGTFDGVATIESNFQANAMVVFQQIKTGNYLGLGVVSLDDQAPQAVATAARSDLGFLYALENLNAFAVVGDDSLYTNLNPADYTDQYLLDRASLLEDKLIRAVNDFPQTGVGSQLDGQGPYAGQFIHFIDDETGYETRKYGGVPEDAEITIRFGLDNNPATETLTGTLGKDHLYGRGGNDTLIGGQGDDYLEGGQGVDRLEGGDGDDRYIYRTGEGADVIQDQDKTGRIEFDSTVLTGGTRPAGGTTYTSVDGQYTYDWNGTMLVINGVLTVENFNSGDLGIFLYEEVDPADPSDPNVPNGPNRAVNDFLRTDSLKQAA